MLSQLRREGMEVKVSLKSTEAKVNVVAPTDPEDGQERKDRILQFWNGFDDARKAVWEAVRSTPLWAEEWIRSEAHKQLWDKFVQSYEDTIEFKDQSESTS